MAVKIDKENIYDLTEDVYHADPVCDPSLSSSVAKVILEQSPWHAWARHPRLNQKARQNNSEKMDLGKAAHAFLLQGLSPFSIIEADDWRTKAAKEARDAAYASGKTPVKADDWAEIQAMVDAARKQLRDHREASDAFTHGMPEQTLIWKEGSAWCRARLDWLPDLGKKAAPVFYDYKTTSVSANPDAWGARQLWNIGYDIQAAFYRRGIKRLLGINDARFRFVVQENFEPYALSVLELDPGALDLAEQRAEKAVQIWTECITSGKWPGYAPYVAHIAPPMWVQSRWEDQKFREEMLKDRLSDQFMENYAI